MGKRAQWQHALYSQVGRNLLHWQCKCLLTTAHINQQKVADMTEVGLSISKQLQSRRLQRKFQKNTLKVTIVSVPPKQKQTWWEEWCPVNNYTQQLCLSPMTPILLLNTYSIANCVKLERQLNSKMEGHSLQRVVRISRAKTKAI
jgi:hypothetical protein